MNRYVCMALVVLAHVVTGFTAYGNMYGGGSGTAADPYRISKVEHWTAMVATPADLNKHFILTSDIDFSWAALAPVGQDTDASNDGFQGTAFTGVFNGKGFCLRHAVIIQESNDYVGVFGCLGGEGMIRDLGVENITVSGRSNVGGLAGYASGGGAIISCYATGAVTGNDDNVGGLVGKNEGGTITSCHASGAVTGNADKVGGLVGYNGEGSAVTLSNATGEVTGSGAYVGGLVGFNLDGDISACFAKGPVAGKHNSGGLVGYNSELASISSCYAMGAVMRGDSIGGLVAWNEGGAITSCYATGNMEETNYLGGYYLGGLIGKNTGIISACYWNKESTSQEDSAGGEGRTTAEMTHPNAANTYVGWSFTEIWASDTDYTVNSGYPFLRGNVPAPVPLSVTPAARNIGAEAKTTTFSIKTMDAWGVVSNARWATLSAASGRSDATLEITCAANSGPARSATITVTGRLSNPESVTVTVSQAAAPALTVTPVARDVAAAGGVATFDIATTAAWSVASDASWAIPGEFTGSGNTLLTVSCEANAGPARTATITVTGTDTYPGSVIVTIEQPDPNAPSLVVTPGEQAIGASGGTTSFTITTAGIWTVTSDASWAVPGKPGGTGNATLTVSCEANAGEARSATITVTGTGTNPGTISVTLNQAAAPALGVMPVAQDVGASGGTVTFDVVTTAAWTVVSDVPWAALTTADGTGNAALAVSCEANVGEARSATITVTGVGTNPESVTVTVNQAAAPTLSLEPTERDMGAPGGTTMFTISTTADWTAESNAAWAVLGAAGGSGNGALPVACEANIGAARTATIIVTGVGTNPVSVMVTVKQAAAPILTVVPDVLDIGAAGGTTTFEVITTVDWTASSDAAWATLSPTSGTGDTVLNIACKANTGPERTAVIIVKGAGTSPGIAKVTQATPASEGEGEGEGERECPCGCLPGCGGSKGLLQYPKCFLGDHLLIGGLSIVTLLALVTFRNRG